MSQSMLLSKSSYSYGATKNNYFESREEYNPWATNVKQPNFNYQAHDNQTGHGSSNRGTNYYTQAHCAQPTPTINMVYQHGFGRSCDNHSNHGVGQHGFGPGHDDHSAYDVGPHRFEASRDNHSAYDVGQHGFGPSQVNHLDYGAVQNNFGAPNGNYSANGMAKNGFGSGQVNHSGYGVAQNGFGAPNVNYSANDVSHNQFEASQANHSAYGATKNSFGASSANYSANNIAKNGFGSHNYHDHHEADEEVHEIMDEILAKYPAHNVSNGPGSNWATKPNGYASQNQGASYAEQHSFSGQAQHGMAVQSSSNKFQMKNEMKKEFSDSSSLNNFEMNNRGNNGGLCNKRVQTNVECDF